MKTAKSITAWFTLTGAVLTLLMTPAFASGARGGGHVVDVDGKPELLDLVTDSVCDWRSGEEIYAESSRLREVLEKVSKLDWYLALELRREIQYLTYCFTGTIRWVSPNDWVGPIASISPWEAIQAAFRLDGSVYINTEIYKAMSERTRAFLILHETMHSYLPQYTYMRKLKLRSLVRTLSKVDEGKIQTRGQLHFQLKNNDMEFPLTVSRLDHFRDQVEFFVSSPEERIEILRNEANPEKLLERYKEFLPYLAPWDAAMLKEQNPKTILEQAIRDFALAGTEDDFKKILEDKAFGELNPVVVLFSVFPMLDEAKQNLLVSSVVFEEVVNGIYERIMSAEVTYDGFRYYASRDLQRLAGVNPTDLPLTSIRFVSKRAREVPEVVQALAEVITLLIQDNRQDALQALVVENPHAKIALTLALQRSVIAQVNPRVAREKPLALKVLSEIQLQLSDMLHEEIQIRLGKEETENFWNELKKEGVIQ